MRPRRRRLKILLLSVPLGTILTSAAQAQADPPLSTRPPITFAFADEERSRMGEAIANAGDWNGDGTDDLVVGLPGFDLLGPAGIEPEHGSFRVIDPTTGNTLATYAGGPLALSGPTVRLGSAVAGGFDTDGDGRPEIAVGATGVDQVLIFEAFTNLFTGSVLAIEIDRITGNTNPAIDEQQFGAVVVNVGDVNGDGRPDLAVGAPSTDRIVGGVELEDTGSVRLFSGNGLSTLAAWGFTSDGAELGSAIVAVGDLTGDGRPELALGAPGRRLQIGSLGPTIGVVHIVDITALFGGNPILMSISGSEQGDGFGASLAHLGDLDGGGASELAVGSDHWMGALGSQAWGRVSVVRLEDQSELWSREGDGPGTLFASSIAAADVDGFSRPELIVVERRRENTSLPHTTLPAAVVLDALDGHVIERFDASPANFESGASGGFGGAVVGGLQLDPVAGEEFVIGLPVMEFSSGGIIGYGFGAEPSTTTSIWTVDDTGSEADFRALSHAALVAVGHDVIEVAEGNYGRVFVAEPLTLDGRAASSTTVDVQSLELYAEGAASLSSMQAGSLVVRNVSGRVSGSGLVVQGPTRIELSDDVAFGQGACIPPNGTGDTAARVLGSTVQLHQCIVVGASGLTADPGGNGLYVDGSSQVLSAGCVIRAGDAGPPLGFFTAPSQPAIEVRNASTLDLRGNAGDVVEGGDDSFGVPPPVDVFATPNSSVTVSPSLPPFVVDGPAQYPFEQQSWISYRVDPPVGGSLAINSFGPAGSPLVLLQALLPAQFSVPTLEGTIWLDPTAVVGVQGLTTQGVGNAAQTFVLVPDNPVLIGLELQVQGFQLLDTGIYAGTNGGAVRFVP